ncbi:MAG: Holliday junction resolvase RecU [Bacilli bacterium]|nr:Holliday junction resolvase RecU [Bacilli bacterium]
MLTIKNNKLINYGNRGMTLEEDINLTNNYYKEKGIALIYKKPIPIKVLQVNTTKTRIKDGFYERKSTLDYSGIYKEKYIEFDAKETNSKTSFPINNIHPHQIEHIKNIIKYKGIVFLIIRFNYYQQTFILKGNDLINFINNNERKSIPYSYFTDNCQNIELKYNPRLDYLKIIDIL